MKNFLRWITIAIASTACMSFAFAQDRADPGAAQESVAEAAVAPVQVHQGCPAAVFDHEELMGRREVQIASYELYRETQAFPRVNSMWVTYKNGKLGFVRWDNTQMRNEAFWKGPPPECTVAIIHTHPAGKSKEPCYLEHQLANGEQASGVTVPVYVLHHSAISKVVPGSPRVLRVRETGWLNDFAAKHGERSGLIALSAER